VNGPDEELAREAKRGSQVAFASLVRRNQSLVRGFLRKMTADSATADDLAQETFVMAWRKINSYEEKGSFRGWLCRIAYTQFLQQRRSSQSALRRDTAAFAEMDQTVSEGGAVEAKLDLERAMKVLTPEQKAAVSLCYGEGMSHSEAAEVLGLPLGTVKSHVLRGRERMLAVLREKEAS